MSTHPSHKEEPDRCGRCDCSLGPYVFTTLTGPGDVEFQIPAFPTPYILADLESGDYFICESCYQTQFFTCFSKDEQCTIHYEFGLEFANFGRYNDSIAALSAAAEIRRSSDVLLSLARVFGMSGRLDKELDLLQEAFDANSENPLVMHNLIICLVGARSFADALRIVDRCFGRLGRDDQLLMWVAEIFFRKGDMERAAAYYEHALNLAHCDDCRAEFRNWWESLRGEESSEM
ncbi:MAG: tetratricopeptide repeat protein [Bdellovibrionales bacterium]|nr:tetratricopeptide repeat protein [Bdellovibrionales bacterium]